MLIARQFGCAEIRAVGISFGIADWLVTCCSLRDPEYRKVLLSNFPWHLPAARQAAQYRNLEQTGPFP